MLQDDLLDGDVLVHCKVHWKLKSPESPGDLWMLWSSHVVRSKVSQAQSPLVLGKGTTYVVKSLSSKRALSTCKSEWKTDRLGVLSKCVKMT